MKYLSALTTFVALIAFHCAGKAQTVVSSTDLTNAYKAKSFTQTSVHDPSVVWDSKSQYYYIFGSHYAGAKSKDLRNWSWVGNYYNTSFDKAFKQNTPRRVQRVLPGGTQATEVDFPSFDAAAFCATYAGIKVDDRQPTTEADWVRGDQWAPDVVWNPTMNKWCYYVSLNGDYWASVVVLMTSDNITGPYTYQGPVVFGGFNGQSYSGVSVDYKKTDLEIVLGPQNSLPSRYRTNAWGTYYPNCIDPCAFIDEQGEMWLIYGSWSGGIWMLKLDKETGLRDYTNTYSGTGTSPNATSDDAYFGHRIAGGYYVSGEGPYIQHIGNYYYLFMSYGFYSPDGGYEMRVFRSTKPEGPYTDATGNKATYTQYQMNYGPRAATNRGMKLIGAMNKWGLMTVGECAQGHNSAIVDESGRAFLVCHTKYNNGSVGHNVRTYQLYQNKDGWLVTAPFQFDGETTTDEFLANNQPYGADAVAGDYHVMVHPYRLDYANMAETTPKTIHLSEDGKISGDYTGTWEYSDEGKSYVTVKLGTTVYYGVVVEQTLENNAAKTLCFTTVSKTGVPCWGYKLQPTSAIALNYQNHKDDAFKSTNLSTVRKNVDIMFSPVENVNLRWISSNPDRLSETGKYNPGTENERITMTARLECGDYYWEKTFQSTIYAAQELTGDPYSGIVAYYNCDEIDGTNAYNESQRLEAKRLSTTKVPQCELDYSRFGNVMHTYFGAQKSNSYVRMDNPLRDRADIDGFTVSMWVKRTDANKYDALWSFFNPTTADAAAPRLYLTGNCYLGFNDNAGKWFDANHPDTKSISDITVGAWRLVTVTFSKDSGYAFYVDGNPLAASKQSFAGSVASMAEFDKQAVLDFIKATDNFYLGFGSFWGSADVLYDDILIYDRALSSADVKSLSVVLNRVNDLTPAGILGIEQLMAPTAVAARGIFDLQGRRYASMPSEKGIYVVDGKKVLVK